MGNADGVEVREKWTVAVGGLWVWAMVMEWGWEVGG